VPCNPRIALTLPSHSARSPRSIHEKAGESRRSCFFPAPEKRVSTFIAQCFSFLSLRFSRALKAGLSAGTSRIRQGRRLSKRQLTFKAREPGSAGPNTKQLRLFSISASRARPLFGARDCGQLRGCECHESGMEVGGTQTVDVVLQPATAAETVLVLAGAPELEVNHPDRGNVIESEFVQTMPLILGIRCKW